MSLKQKNCDLSERSSVMSDDEQTPLEIVVPDQRDIRAQNKDFHGDGNTKNKNKVGVDNLAVL